MFFTNKPMKVWARRVVPVVVCTAFDIQAILIKEVSGLSRCPVCKGDQVVACHPLPLPFYQHITSTDPKRPRCCSYWGYSMIFKSRFICFTLKSILFRGLSSIYCEVNWNLRNRNMILNRKQVLQVHGFWWRSRALTVEHASDILR